MEVYAGYQENADHNVGRILDELERMGTLDDTLVIWIWGDNGASLEGTITGSFNELTMPNGIPLTAEQQMQLTLKWGGLEAWGGPSMNPHCSAAWAWAGNTPFQWGKQVASHLGGTRDPMVIHWPARIADAGGLRTQFTHVIDVGPTILDIAGLPQPAEVNGIAQRPMHGTSFQGQPHRRGGAGAPHPAVLRDVRQPGDVQGRLVGGVDAAADPVGGHAGDHEAVRAGRVRPRPRWNGSCTTCPTTSPRPGTWPPSTRRRSGN